ncbi:MAG: carotenoid oxygenase family protein [Oscillatoriales cyanobacterium RM2_1_1]|nr:carotenoid oxygenase family protein [Oscillatoriales cyanobacterium SM2_3_0]NJO47930.1 carotenoid oxygenase family protein [Oscillatoriales cyanobacterium RM2_1_1]
MIPTQSLETSQSSVLSYDPKDWQQGYRSQPNEYDYWIEDIDGEIPMALEGTLFKNGPGLLEIGGQPIHHPFDGDGMVSAIQFTQGRAHYRNRYVRTQGYLAEQQAGKILHRGVFGTQKPGGLLANMFDLKLKNIANTQVIYWGGKLLALWEAAEPHRLDPVTLETMGIDYLEGILQPGDAFAAHPRIDPASALDGGQPCLVNFSIKPGLSTTINLYELATDGRLLRKRAYTVPGFAFIHDFVITPRYCIFFQNPVSYNPFPFLLGWAGAGECVQFQSGQPTQVIMIPRDPQDKAIKTFEVEAGFVFHHANAFEQQEDELIVDSICYKTLPGVDPQADFRDTNFADLDPGQLWRFTFNLETGTAQSQQIEPRCLEFPAIHPAHMGRSYRYLYLGAAHDLQGNAPLQGVLKLDLEAGDRQIWSAAPRGFTGEPIFVPHPQGTQEDQGWVLILVYDASHHRSDLVILDAQNFTAPMARLHLKHHIPYGLHGTFAAV